YYQKHGLPWRNWVFGNLRMLAHLNSQWAPVSNLILRSRLGRWLTEKLVGIDQRRFPPRFLIEQIDEDDYDWERSALMPDAALFPDTFVLYNEREIALAAMKVVQHASCRIFLAPPEPVPFTLPYEHALPSNLRCCGRPLISNGMLDRAVQNARH